MSDTDYILLTISVLIGLTSIVMSSRKSGYLFGYNQSFRDKYTFDKSRMKDFFRSMVLATGGSLVVGLFFSQNILTALDFTAINVVFIGYALAWETIIKLQETK